MLLKANSFFRARGNLGDVGLYPAAAAQTRKRIAHLKINIQGDTISTGMQPWREKLNIRNLKYEQYY